MNKRLPSLLGICCLVAAFSLCASVRGFSQSLQFGDSRTTWEIGINIGPSVFMGDLGGNQGKGTRFMKDFNPQFTKIMKGVYATCYPTDWFGIRVAAEVGQLEGNDDAI